MFVLRMRWMAATLLTTVAVNVAAQAPEPAKPAKLSRLALVIGNAAYKEDRLTNPVNDAEDMAALLRQAGFEVVHRENASLKEMHLALREFGDRLSRETLGLFYFAGHGVQVRGRNYLLAVDADIGREDEVAFNALDLQAVLEKMDTARNHTNLIILDACRNNPFASRFRLANNGLAQIDAPPGTVVAFSTAQSRAKSSQPGAAPRFEVGDWWEWRITNQLTNDVRTVKRRIVAISGDTVTTDNGWIRDLSGNTLREKIGDKVHTYTPSTLFYVFPLTPGLTWSGIAVEKVDDEPFSDLDTRISAIAEEEVDTPMGRFKTIKVERVANWKNRKNGKTGTSRWTYWYTSQAKSALRFERSNTTGEGRVFIKETQELLAFSVK